VSADCLVIAGKVFASLLYFEYSIIDAKPKVVKCYEKKLWKISRATCENSPQPIPFFSHCQTAFESRNL